MGKKVIIIGSGFSSLAASCYLAKYGYDVTILEKNSHIGGRARILKGKGFKFDMGPTWYWMPDVFEKFFNDFNRKPQDYYDLERLSPAYSVVFGSQETITISDKIEAIYSVFEKEEPGSSAYLKKFMAASKKNYDIAINKLVYMPGESITELITFDTMKNANLFFKSISAALKNNIRSKKLIQILEFPVLFLGAKPSKTPSFYNFMNYADFGLGTWHPRGGMYEVVKAMTTLAAQLGVKINSNHEVAKILVNDGAVQSVVVDKLHFPADIVLCGSDYHHSESLLDLKYRMYPEHYWQKRTFAPSALLFFVGFNKKLKNVTHHTLFFDSDFEQHSAEIYDRPKWPEDPLFYASFPSLTDEGFAPEDMESGTFLIPIAPGIQDTDKIREVYFLKIMKRFEALTKQSVLSHVVYKKSYCINNFIQDYHAYKGNAYGLANTLRQTAVLRPKLKSKKVQNLYFTGQLTVPGPGVPPAIISGKIVADLICKNQLNNHKSFVNYERII